MENNKFFIWVWRLSGILFLLIVIFFIGLVLYELSTNMLRSASEDDPILNVAEDPDGEEKWELGDPIDILSNGYLLLPLVSEKREVDIQSERGIASVTGRSSRYEYNPAKNVLFLNTKNNDSFWLFKGTDRLIANTSPFPSRYGSNADDNEVKAIFYYVVSSDTNADQLLTFEDKISLAMSLPDGTGYTTVLNEYEKIISKNLIDDDKVFIVYQTNGVGMSQLIQISPFKVLSIKELPRIEQ